MKLAVLVSGSGTNLQAIIDSIKSGYLKDEIGVVISDKEDAYALKRAEKAGIETFFLSVKDFKNRKAHDSEIAKKLDKKGIELIVLAGFMRILSNEFINKYRNKIINIHPALLPSFKGTHGIKDAFDFGVKETGVTIHFVDEDMDNGPIIMQESVKIEENDTLESLEEKIHKKEHEMYPKAIKLITEGKLSIRGRKVVIEN